MDPISPKNDSYPGFEQGPIRPPSEAFSLLIRVTQNCPWNRCTFCPVYKGTKFSIRPVAHVKRDIDVVQRYVERLLGMVDGSGRIRRDQVHQFTGEADPGDRQALAAAANWLAAGMTAVFLQDANSLIVKTADLVEILEHLRLRFPGVKRITSYARSHTLARMKDEDMQALREAGLTRIHVGLESGSDQVLRMVNKGVTKEKQIEAGLRVRRAGIELSEYTMPGLGGRALSEEHARETADALNQINPDFIRLRPLAIPLSVPLFDDLEAGRFERCSDLDVAAETLSFIEHLEGITSAVKSDHVLNLFADLEGTLPQDKERMLAILRTFLAMPPERQRLYRVGRRLGAFHGLGDLQDPHRLARAETACRELGVTRENIDGITDELLRRFI